MSSVHEMDSLMEETVPVSESDIALYFALRHCFIDISNIALYSEM